MAEFKIGRLRFTWSGPWATDTFYNRDAVTQFNGRTYVCLVPHTSDVFYDDLEHEELDGALTPKWTMMMDGKTWVGAWTANTAYNLGNIATYGGSVYFCTTHHTSASGATAQIDLTKWATYSITDKWNSDWTVTTVYGIGDVVKYGGIVYRCIENHVSAASNALGLEDDQSSWEIVNSGVEYKTDWTTATKYKINDLVKVGPNIYIAIENHTSNIAFDPTKWDMWLPGEEYTSTYSTTRDYQLGDVVEYGGYSYVSIFANNKNNTPSTSPLRWSVLTKGYEFSNEWTSAQQYKVGDIVRRSGMLYTAVADSASQDPSTGVSINYLSAGSSGTTVVLSGTTNIRVGMILVGNGFSQQQTVIEINDLSTITVSAPPDGTPGDLSPIYFSGVNFAFWALLVPGNAWRNRWTVEFDSEGFEIGIQYFVGDAITWKNTTYICVRSHTSSTSSYPDADLTRSTWAYFIPNARKNAMGQLGDIETYNNAYSAVSIGEDSYILRASNDVPAWRQLHLVPAVYYVSPEGTDISTYGNSWDKPWKTIKYACDVVGAGTLNQDAVYLIKQNKNFIIAEMYQWMLYQKDNSISPFGPSSTFDEAKTRRDAGYIVDAVVYDLSRGGNSQTVAATLAYFTIGRDDLFVTTTVTAEIQFFKSALGRLQSLITQVISNELIDPLYQEINEVQDIITQTIDNNKTAETTANPGIVALMAFLLEALNTQSTKKVPPPNSGLTATIMVKTGTYEEVLPITVPENVALNGDELRGVVVQPAKFVTTIATSSSDTDDRFTVYSTSGIEADMPVQFAGNVFGGITAGVTYYVLGSTITSTKFGVSTEVGGAIFPLELGGRYMTVFVGDSLKDMFYVRNGSGIRNMTLQGLCGTLTEPNGFGTQRPTGGSYVSLDPGLGTNDTSAWIFRKSPYIQNVTTFGQGATGLKIDGTLHAGGNRSIVCNDFTQIISDGIGVWVTGSGSVCEAVSVFSYYGYAGYFAEDGGRLRATNGNTSYGQYGCIAEGYDATETPITGTIYNKSSQVQASVQSSFGSNAQLVKLQYANAGSGYNKASTNLLNYSNDFLGAGWTTDGNISIAKNTTAPTTLVEAWSLTGNTTATDGSYMYQNIAIQPAGATYTGVSGVTISGGGSLATFDITVTSTVYVVVVNVGGSGYVGGNQINIPGDQLGGTSGVNDCVLTVSRLAGSSILEATATGTVPTGSALSYTVSAYVKQGTAPSIDIQGIFSGSSTVTSNINFNFITGAIVATAPSGGFIPVNFGKITLTDGWYRLWFATNDTTGLNTQLQYRIYPRGYAGITGNYTYFYGNQVELSGTDYIPNFYLETTDVRYTAYANYNVIGAGTGAQLLGDESRSGAVFQTRVTDLSGRGAGGAGYLTSSNSAQGGTNSYIILAQSDVNVASNYFGMRVFINSGTGAGQYGYISAFDTGTKIAQVLKESFDSLRITNTASSGNKFTLSASLTTDSLYVDQPVQFIPTSYNTIVTATSVASTAVSAAIGGVINTLTVASTLQLEVNMPIRFSGVLFSNVVENFTYYIYDIIDEFTIQITNQLYGTVWQLTNATINTVNMTMSYPSYTGYLTAPTDNMVINYPTQFTGVAIGGVAVGTTYYINDVINSNTFTVSNSLSTVTATASSSSNNGITVDSTSGLTPLNPILFSGTTFGNIQEGTKYYISRIINSLTISVASSLIYQTATATESVSNLITVNDTTGYIANNPIVFVGLGFGNIVAETVYYILAVNNSTTFTISQTPGGSSVPLEDAVGNIIVKTAPAAVTLTTVPSGSMTGTTTQSKNKVSYGYGSMNTTFSTALFGNVQAGNTYYINTIDSANRQFTITAIQGSGTAFTLGTKTGSMNIAAVGWDHINIGTAIASALDSSSVYYIEPRTIYDKPLFAQSSASITTVSLAPGTNWTSMAYGDNYFMAFADGDALACGSTDGKTWTSISLPVTGTWTGVAYGNKYWVAIAGNALAGSNKVLYSNSRGAGWRTSTLPASTNWNKVVYGNGKFVAIASGTANSAYSTNYGKTWSSGTGLQTLTWTGLAYGAGKFVAIASGSRNVSVSSNGTSWTTVTNALPTSTTWSAIAYGNGRFVAVSSTSARTAYSFDGSTWYQSNIPIVATKIAYGQGIFVAVASASTTAYTSEGGLDWDKQTVSADSYGAIKFGVDASTYVGIFTTLSGTALGSTIRAGSRAKGRAVVTSGKITSISQWEAGSGYVNAPSVTFIDPNVTDIATVTPRLGNGALGNPTFITRGSGYNSTSTFVYITGSGYADQYQTGLTLIINNLTKLPLPGDNLTIAGVSQIYKVTNATVAFGTSAPNIEANVQIAPDMSVANSPADDAAVVIRQKYSQVRLTGHDFLSIGYGNKIQTNYPDVPEDTILSAQNQCVEVNYGRVFFTSTDQDGNFKVGNLFGVEQATGIVTLSASQFGLTGLDTLSLGGIAVGGSSVIVTQFSTDSTFVANSDSIIPTQRSIKTYLTSRLSQGGSNTFTGQLIAGTVLVGGPNKIGSTVTGTGPGSSIKIANTMIIQGALGGVDGNLTAFDFFMQQSTKR